MAASSSSTGTGARRISKTGQCASTTSLSFANSSGVAELFNVTVPCTPVKPARTRSSTAKNPPQVENAIEFDRDAFQRNAKGRRVATVRDFLACSQRGQDQLHRVRASVGAAETRWLIDRQRELANPSLAPEVLHLPRIDRKDGLPLAASARRLACVSTMISFSDIPVSQCVFDVKNTIYYIYFVKF
jgi:hypothetical protein